MCIRDSEGGLRRSDFGHISIRPDHSIVELPDDLPRDVFDAVSYTHLRAHETVLDLVCRLLLEKKTHKHI